MMFQCSVCGYIADKDDDWLKVIEDGFKCPICESPKAYFKPMPQQQEQIIQTESTTTVEEIETTPQYECTVCAHIHEDGENWLEKDDDWKCPVCESPKSYFKTKKTTEVKTIKTSSTPQIDISTGNSFEKYFNEIKQIAEDGKTIIEPMKTLEEIIGWEDVLIMGAQLSKVPLNEEEGVNTTTVIGPRSKIPMELKAPLFITHMSFGALSREAKTALAKGSAGVGVAMCSGEGGIVPESLEAAHKYVFEYVPNEYSVTEENLKKVDAIEIKIGQGTKPGMGGHLPGKKVTEEIAEVRGKPIGEDVISPAHFKDILDKESLKEKVRWLRDVSGGRPIGIKLAAGNIEKDLEIATFAGPDFITIDGRGGGTGASPKFVKAATSVPTIFALARARKYLDENNFKDISLVITGGLKISSDIAKALALGADAIAIGTSALIALGCYQHRACHIGKCQAGIMTQDPDLRKVLNIEDSSRKLENFLKVTLNELKDFARLTGNNDVHGLEIEDLATTSSEISDHTDIRHV
jgi:methylamine---glutamate N-methyltransferase subunit C